MTLLQEVLEAEKKRSAGRTPEPRSSKQAARGSVAANEVFKTISPADVSFEEMEVNKILPALDDRSAVTAYKMMRTRVLQRMRSNNWRTLIVTSAGPGEGKTTTACNLALSISHDVNQAVILVDLDLQRPSLAECFGLEVEAGIGDYLTGQADLQDIVYAPTGMDRIAIIPNRAPVPHSSELLASPRMRDLVDWLKNQGPETISIFDLPPILACDDVLAFSPFADAILMIVAEGKAERIAVSRSIELIADRELLGVVLNQSREKSSISSYY